MSKFKLRFESSLAETRRRCQAEFKDLIRPRGFNWIKLAALLLLLWGAYDSVTGAWIFKPGAGLYLVKGFAYFIVAVLVAEDWKRD